MRIFFAIAGLVLVTGCATTQTTSAPVAQAGSAKPSAPTLNVELAKRFATERGIELYNYHFKYIGNDKKMMAPLIRTRDGGYLLVGTHHDFPSGEFVAGKSTPKVFKLDANGKVVWEQSILAKGFATFEAVGAIELDQGYAIFIKAYYNPAITPASRFHRIDDQGKEVWNVQLRGRGGPKTPFPSKVQLVGDKLMLDGHIYQDKSETAYKWHGEISLQGKLLVDTVGGVITSWEDND